MATANLHLNILHILQFISKVGDQIADNDISLFCSEILAIEYTNFQLGRENKF